MRLNPRLLEVTLTHPPAGVVYPEDDPFRIPLSTEMLEVAQAQYRDNEEARAARLQEALRPSLIGGPNSQADLVTLFVEHPNLEDDALSDYLGLDISEVMEQVWERRPISQFACLEPSCREPIPIRNRKHLLRLLRIEKYLGTRVAAGDLVEFRTLCEMLCGSCSDGLQLECAEQHRADLSIRKARIAELRKMPYKQYRRTKEWQARRTRVLQRAGGRCEVCYASGLIDVHHRSYSRYGDELLSDLIALCRPCHQRHHGIAPEVAESG